VFFGHSPTVTIPAGGTVESDPVSMPVLAGEDLAVSMYIPQMVSRPSLHGEAFTTSFLTENEAGDFAADEVRLPPGSNIPARSPFTKTTNSLLWLKSIDVRSQSAIGSIVAFGDSITDGWCTAPDSNERWEDWLAVRLDLAGAHMAVVNEGIGGNTLTKNVRPAGVSVPAVERLDRDVLSHHGVTHVILFEGTNDIRRSAPTTQVVNAMQDIAQRVKTHGIKVFAATIIPRHAIPSTSPEANNGWDDHKATVRREVNTWLLGKTPFDKVFDFDKVMRDPNDPEKNFPAFNCDGIHPSARGYYEIAKSLPLELFTR
jgi:lysophospholipase L1-like esterase